ncbi:MAG: tetratricopeptide repeat protein [Limnospira sp. PMC 1281.21]|uniref:rhamnosyltransferase WsaF family glycosyltransferase n=1 Tax=Limnospira sp. PMC 1281.21 TaxID=2981064 RepID=UPI0028E0EE53|nr:tetratricopeptide repeat protein [Limnospira sp. PMC 1281.21]MDT9302518.1 tetratricopeptide repeat protein [Limnospira sp. PMC 1281.21]
MTSTVDNSSLEIANKLLQQGKIQEAVAEYRRGIELTPDLSWHHYYLGEALTQLEDWEGAVSAYRQAISLGSNYLCYYRLGVALVKLERWDEAIEVLNQGLELKPDYYKFYLPLGQALVHQQHWEPAMEAYRKAVALKPGVAEFNLQLGYLLRRHGRFQEAAGYLQRAVDFQGDDPQLQLALGVALVEGGTDLDRAEGCLRRSLELQPDQGEAYFYLGKLCQGRDQLQDALGFYRRCGELSPGVDSALAVAAVLEKLGRWTEAVDQYRQVVLEFGECGPASLGLGRALAELERPVEAVVEWRRAVKLGVETPEVHRLLAETLVELGRWSEVVEHWKWLLERYPGAVDWRRRLALALMGLGRWTEAAAQWGEYWRVAPGSGRGRVVDFRPQKKTHGEIDHSQELSITGDLTVEFWLYLRDWPKSWTDIISKFVSDEQNEFCFRLKDDQKGQWYYGKGDGCSTSINWVPKKDMRLHEWVHVACVRKVGQYGRIYFNGVLRREDDWSGESEAVGTEAPVRLMGSPQWQRFHDGKLSEVRLWNRARSGDEIREGMCEGLTGEEPGLVGLWHGDESDEGVLVDAVGHHHGRLVMAADAGKERPRVGVCGWELSHNAAGRAYTLAQLYGGFAEVELIGCLFPKYGGQVWEPIRGGEIRCHTIRVEDEGRFIEQALGLVWAHPYEVVHLSKPRMPNIIFGLLYKLVWGARVIVDIDDEELTFVKASETLDLRELLESGGKLPPFQGWDGGKWTRLAVGLARAFDGVTVANPALQERYGGVVIRHGRDEARFVPSDDRKRGSRERFGIAQDKKVVLFFGTPRKHKGLVTTARALGSLGRKDVVFAIIGDFEDGKLKEELQGIPGVDYVFVGNQPFESIPDVVAVGDICVLLQDVGSEVSQFQIPAKLSDALGMGLVVLLSETAAVADVIESGAVVPVAEGDLPAVLDRVLSDEAECNKFRVRGRELLAAEFGFGVNGSRLATVMDEVRSGVGVLSDELNLLFGKLQPVSSILAKFENGRVKKAENLKADELEKKQISDGQLLERVQEYFQASRYRTKKVVVYTAICNNYDILKIPEFLCPDWDYVCFTDREQYPGDHPWKIKHFDYIDQDHTRTARYVKTHPHIYFESYECSIWIDAHILIKTNFIEEFTNNFLINNELFAAIPHPFRNCTYQEAKICIQQEKDDKDIIESQIVNYKYEGLPSEWGMIESGVLIRRHNNSSVRKFNELWWKEIDTYSKRDQLSVMFVLWKTNLNWVPLMKQGQSTRNHPGFRFFQHGLKETKRDKAYQIPSFLPKEFSCEITPFWLKKFNLYDRNSLKSFYDYQIDIIICVHNALKDVIKCLESVINNLLENHRVIIVDDGSDSDTQEYLRRIASQNHSIALIRHEVAKGYTKSANVGMRVSDAPFVILLNSDTIVSPNWAVKLLQAAQSSSTVGVVGPMSNAASYQSVPFLRYPHSGQMMINELPQDKTIADMDSLCEQYGWFHNFPRVPLVNGFCYGIKREVIEAIGYFNEKAFPKGYGEEDDYSIRALDAGFTHVIASHCYVFHAKSKSFGSQRKNLAEAGREALGRLHGYKRIERYTGFMKSNPFLCLLRVSIGNVCGFKVPDQLPTQLSILSNKTLPESSVKSSHLQAARYNLSKLAEINPVIFPKELSLAEISLQELQQNQIFTRNMMVKSLTKTPEKVLWIIPNCRNILAGGIRTIFMVAEEFSRCWNTKNIFVIQITSSTKIFYEKSTIQNFFPDLNFELIAFDIGDNPSEIPRTDIALCSAWHTAYLLARYNSCKAKFYFMQDYESLFYPAGSVSGVIDMTYRFGFHCIANSLGIAEKYKQYGDNVMYFNPGIDRSIYYPKLFSHNDKPWQVVFYGRPTNKRNAFALGIESLKLVKSHFQDDVRIVSVGSDWNPEDYGVESIIENLGVLDSLEKVASLYRNSHVGLVFMLTPHPSYQPLEYMASGCATVTNANLGTSWLFKHEHNSLLSSILPEDVAGNIIRLLENNKLREQIIQGGLETTKTMDWKVAYDRIKKFVINPDSQDISK